MGKTAIVIGATGLVGQALTDQLAAASHIEKIVTITRRPANHPQAKVHNQVVDFAHLDDFAELFKADLLFSCLGTTRKEAGSITAQRQVDLNYQFAAAQLAASQGVTHYLLISASGANIASNNPYLKMKGELEQRIQTLPFKRISIFQPSLLRGKRVTFRFGEQLANLILPIICLLPGLQAFRPITGAQVAAKMVQVSHQSGPPLAWFRRDEIFPG